MAGHYFARQPIFDREQRRYAYELLYRGQPQINHAGEFDGDVATTEVMISSLIDVGLDTVVGDCPALINVTAPFLLGEIALPVEKERLVLEVLEDIQPTPEICDAVRRLAEEGYRIALDDYEHRPEFEPLLAHVELIKLDVRALSELELAEHVTVLRPFGCALLAEKVETRAEYERCRALGFDYFQGYFFCEPEQIDAKRPGVNHTSALRLMTLMQDENCGFDEVQDLIAHDAALSVRLLRFVNSPFCGLGREVNSVRDALSFVGLDLIRRWVTLMLMSRLGERKSSELIKLALVRGRSCELLGAGCSVHEPGEYFTVGLFSILDALIDQPLKEAVGSLPLNESVSSALLHGSGVLGETLKEVLACERAPLEPLSLEKAAHHQEALVWSEEVVGLA